MFVYCLNRPIQYADHSGNFADATNPNAHCYDSPPSGVGGGSVVTFVLLELLADAISDACDWIEDQKQAIQDKLTVSLAKASSRQYRTEYEEHHLVARKSPNAAIAANILYEVLPGGVEDPLNKAFVKTSVHRRLHTNLYYSFANHLVISAYLQAGVNDEQKRSNVVAALTVLRLFVESLNAFATN